MLRFRGSPKPLSITSNATGAAIELGLATRFNLRHHPLSLPAMAPMGMGMLKRGRMGLTPERIQDMPQLTRILERAKALEETP